MDKISTFVGTDKYAAIKHVENELKGSVSAEMQKVRKEYTPKDKFLPKP